MKKLIAFDLDRTLTKNNCWKDLHEYFKVDERIRKEHMRLYKEGKINFDEWVKRDIALWGKPNIEEVESVLLKYELHEGVEEVFEELKEDYYTAIISCGIDIRAKSVGERLNINEVFSNPLIIENGKVVSGKGIVSPETKGECVEKLRKKLGIERKQTICVGDSEFDKSMFEVCGIKVAFNCKDGLKDHADYTINRFEKLLEILYSMERL
jgi:HAD superfamily PSPase-like hydrolase